LIVDGCQVSPCTSPQWICDLRGYTAFTETAEPEEVLDFLREFHGALGPLASQFEGAPDQFSGDGIMVFFNDPVPIPDPAERAVKMTAGAFAAAPICAHAAVGSYAVSVKGEPIEEHKESGVILDLTRCGAPKTLFPIAPIRCCM
jgi:hypothetical protein